ncbi:uncharacterized protein DNG_09751 [Cephalotrichum gorgonifer]|uniref:Uncharacterized protein n=1 Tax=Cephalotrichum gorgonifer TaxID=2041049 RepID=A0AAE8N6F9_9PEZI|nr:uncharacterized protein DNG_09751 [Cephalotrichum gorgonifer]
MHIFSLLLVAAQAVVLIDAAPDPPGSIKWTLHRSCYRNQDNTADDNEMADAMVSTMATVMAWASRGAEMLDSSLNPLSIKGRTTKRAMESLIDIGDYKTQAEDIRNRFRQIATLEGPIGKGDSGTARYDGSTAWTDLGGNNQHYWDFLLVCRPDLGTTQTIDGLQTVPFDNIRQYRLFPNAPLQQIANEGNGADGQWMALTGGRIQAVTQRDLTNPPQGDRGRIPQTINFHPLWLKYLREKKFEGWSAGKFTQVTATNALEAFRVQSDLKNQGKGPGEPKVDIRPIDSLLDASLVRNLFHELFHLDAFGGMLDQNTGAYGWVNNINDKNHQNPDFFAIVAAIIELLFRDGDQYKVTAEGEVKKK